MALIVAARIGFSGLGLVAVGGIRGGGMSTIVRRIFRGAEGTIFLPLRDVDIVLIILTGGKPTGVPRGISIDEVFLWSLACTSTFCLSLIWTSP